MLRKRLLWAVLPTVVAVTAVAGGTFAVFHDTDSAGHPKFKAGTIEINVTGETLTSGFLTPGCYDDWKPGDSDDYDFEVCNTGTNKAWLQLYIYETGPWVEGKPNFWDHATWSVQPTSIDSEEWNRWVLDPGECKDFTLHVDFPQWVGNDYMGAQGDLVIMASAKQWRNKYEEGYACVPLEDKDTVDWAPILNNELEGLICFKPDGAGGLMVDLNAYGLTPNAYYQLDFTGGDVNNPIDGACTAQDAAFAGMPGDLFVSGYWNWGSVLEATCNSTSGGEGVWNYAGVYSPGVQADDLGSINFGTTLTGLPTGTYQGVGAHVKEIKSGGSNVTDDTLLPGDEWNVVLNEVDYLSFTLP